MLRLDIWPDAIKFLHTVERKHAAQITLKLFSLLAEPNPPDPESLKGTALPHKRADVGEYRIICRVERDVIEVPIIGRRKGDDFYKEMKRKGL